MNKILKSFAGLFTFAFAVSTLAACAPGGQGGTPKPPEPNPPVVDPVPEIPENAIVLTSSNATNTATSYFSARYSDEGIHLDAYVLDDDIHSEIYYSHGYDDNVEYLVGTKYEGQTGWDAGNTLHFLITADGDTSFERAVSSNGLGKSYAPDLYCVYGKNFSYSSELTPFGYRTSVFLGYELFGVDAAAGRNNLYVCPAMRNTHDYADTVWTPFREGGCDWGNASSFLRVGENGYVIDRSKETELLILGDSQLETANWKTFVGDFKETNVVNLAASGTKIIDWQNRIQSIADYAPRNVVAYVGMDEIASAEETALVAQTETLLEKITIALPKAEVYAVNLLGETSGANGQKIEQFNAALAASAQELGVTVIDGAAVLSQSGALKAGYAGTDGKRLNQLGYNVLSKLIRGAVGIAGAQSGAFGDGSMYASSAAVAETAGVTVLDGVYDQYTYFKNCGGEAFYAEAELSAERVYNSDAYPKFGIVLSSGEESLFFYVDGSNGLQNKSVGYVEYDRNNTWKWESSVEQSCEISYAQGGYCKLALLKYQGYLFFYVDGELIFTLDGLDAYGVSGNTDVGILSFNTKLLLKNARYTEENLSDYM